MRKPATCKGCELEYVGTGWVPPTGGGTNGVLIVGEAPGAQEADTGVPWVGAAGHFLDRILRQAGAERSQFRLHNCCSCRPPGNDTPSEGALLKCRQYLQQTIDEMQPRVIIACGGTALQNLTNHHGIQRCRGFILDSYAFRDKNGQSIPVIPTYHPSYLLPGRARNEPARDNPHRYLGMVVLDVKKALKIAREGLPPVIPEDYLRDPGAYTASLWADRVLSQDPPPKYLSVDIETLMKIQMAAQEDAVTTEDDLPGRGENILRVGFCDTPGHAMTIPWDAEHKPIIQRLLLSPIPKLFWNGYGFDIPILEGAGMTIQGPCHDGMWAWHVLQSDLDRKLERVTALFGGRIQPWKHLMEADPTYYNCLDVDAALRNMLAIEQELRSVGQWDFYLKYHLELDPILYQAGRVHGLDIDREAQRELDELLTAEIRSSLLEAQRLVPEAVKNVTVYTRPPKDGTPVLPVTSTTKVRVCSVCQKPNVNRKHPCLKDPKALIETLVVPAVHHQVNQDPATWPDLSSAPLGEVERWIDRAGFNPNSNDHLRRYVNHHKHKATGPSQKQLVDKMDADALYWLNKSYKSTHPIYALIDRIRDLKKTKGTYVDGFAPDERGRIYTTFSRVPSTYRFSSRNVNLQNVSHRGDKEFAQPIRRTIIPPPGHVFVSCDWSAIEAVLVGYFAEDEVYVRAAQQGIHDYVNCLAHKVEFTEENRQRSKTEWKDDREKYKRVVHLSNYGGTPHRMHQAYPEVFTIKGAAILQQEYFSLFPSIPAWHERTRLTAHHQHYLQSPWGFRHYFWRVFYKEDGRLVEGEDAKRCLAFLPQHTAAMMMSDLILTIPPEYRQFMGANLSIHDEVTLCVPGEMAERVGEMLLELMTRPVPQLGGLRVGAECKMGEVDGSWATVKPWKELRI